MATLGVVVRYARHVRGGQRADGACDGAWRDCEFAGGPVASSITGIAGPGGGTAEKPVGLVHFAAARRGGETEYRASAFRRYRSRHEVRMASVEVALQAVTPGALSDRFGAVEFVGALVEGMPSSSRRRGEERRRSAPRAVLHLEGEVDVEIDGAAAARCGSKCQRFVRCSNGPSRYSTMMRVGGVVEDRRGW